MKRLFIIGNGGHARVVESAAALSGWKTFFICADEKSGSHRGGSEHLVAEQEFLNQPPEGNDWSLICGIGSVGSMGPRAKLLQRYETMSSRFTHICHPAAIVDARAQVHAGAFIGAGAILVAGSYVSAHCIINTGAIIEHDSSIGANAHIATGAIVAGVVTVDRDVFVGCGARVIQGCRIGSSVIIGAGAVVVHSLPDSSGTWIGVPAKKALRQGTAE